MTQKEELDLLKKELVDLRAKMAKDQINLLAEVKALKIYINDRVLEGIKEMSKQLYGMDNALTRVSIHKDAILNILLNKKVTTLEELETEVNNVIIEINKTSEEADAEVRNSNSPEIQQ